MRPLRSTRQNYVLGAERPDVPHVECTDGFVWHPAEERRHCFSGWVLDVPTVLLATVYRGEPIERVWSLRTLLESEDLAISQEALMHRLFPTCERSQCDANSYYRSRWYRAAMAIHPDAIPYLREARPTMRSLLAQVNPGRRRVQQHKNSNDPRVAGVGCLPAYDSPERTRDEQIAWAAEVKEYREAG